MKRIIILLLMLIACNVQALDQDVLGSDLESITWTTISPGVHQVLWSGIGVAAPSGAWSDPNYAYTVAEFRWEAQPEAHKIPDYLGVNTNTFTSAYNSDASKNIKCVTKS